MGRLAATFGVPVFPTSLHFPRGGAASLVFFRAKSSPSPRLFVYYAFPARWTGNAKIRRGWVPP